MRLLISLILALNLCPAWAAPHTPRSDDEVLERLPFKASAAEGQELRRLRRAFAEQPQNPERALALARRYFDLASAEGDPRYVGYAEAIIRPWSASAEPPVEVLDPGNAEVWSWRSAILLVQADYAGARAACDKLAAVASALLATACTTAVDGLTGKSARAYAELSKALARRPDADPDFKLWIQTRLAEMALRQGQDALAERHFKAGLALGVTDGFILAAYADFLLDRDRSAEVVAMSCCCA